LKHRILADNVLSESSHMVRFIRTLPGAESLHWPGNAGYAGKRER